MLFGLVERFSDRCACTERVMVLGLCVCVSACLLTIYYSHTTGYNTAFEEHHKLQHYKRLKNNV